MNKQRLFTASCIALIATAMSFAIRGDIMGDFERIFALNKTNVGWIAGAAFWGFGLSIFIGGPLCDILGMGTIMRLAAAGHIGGTLLTLVAPNFEVLFAATVIIGIANGLVEAAINPLVATVYSDQKVKKLTALHAWFPGGIVIGGVLCFLFSQIGLGWQAKMLLMLVPSVIYTLMFIGQRFPETERQAAGVPFNDMFKEVLRPLFLLIWLCMWLTAATELGPGQWYANIFNDVMHSQARAGILVLVWVNGIMYLLRQFGGGLAHRVSPVALLMITTIPAALGLYLFGHVSTAAGAFGAVALLAIGTAFWWPTMLGITSERFPRTGALGLAIIGGSGSFATAIAGPVMGWINDTYGPRAVLPTWAILPAALFVIFGLIYVRDRSVGGYKIERLQAQPVPDKSAI
jgi:MFS family permease